MTAAPDGGPTAGNAPRVILVGPFPRDRDRPRGGVEAVSSNLVHGIAAVSRAEVQVLTLCADIDRQVTEPIPNGEVTFVPARPGLTGWWHDLHGRLLAEVRRRDGDLVHVQGLASIAARLPGALLTVHGAAERATYRTRRGIGGLVRGGALLVTEAVPRRAARRVILTTTRPGPDAPSGQSGGQRRYRRAWHIPNPIDPAFFAAGSDPRDPLLFVCISRITPLKNVAGVVRAFAPVAASGPARLLIAGNGRDTPYGQFCQTLVSRMGLTRSVTFLGGRSIRESADLLREAGTLVHFSRQENLPLVVAEALAAGTAVVATGVGEVPELLRDAPGCQLVSVGDERALTDQMLLRCLGDTPDAADHRRARANVFRPEAVAARTLAVYSELLDTRPPRMMTGQDVSTAEHF